jgi:hypothetical protein
VLGDVLGSVRWVLRRWYDSDEQMVLDNVEIQAGDNVEI